MAEKAEWEIEEKKNASKNNRGSTNERGILRGNSLKNESRKGIKGQIVETILGKTSAFKR